MAPSNANEDVVMEDPKIRQIQKTLAFTEEEYRQRLARVRATMAERGLDGLLVHGPENICYLSGFRTSGYYFLQMLVVPLEADPIFVVRLYEKGNMAAFSWLNLDRGHAYRDNESATETVAQTVHELGLTRGRLGVDRAGFFLPVGVYAELESLLPEAELADGTGIVEKQRAVKSPAEIAYIRRSCWVSAQGMQALVDHCREGRTENAVAGEIHKALVSNGGEYTGLPVFFSSGHRVVIPHANWTDKIIERGDLVYVELTGVTQRYAGPHLRCLIVGEPSKAQAADADMCREMLEAAIDAIRPGTTSHAVDTAVRRVLERYNYPTEHKNRCGYSIGLNFPPDWGEGYFLDLKQGDETVLEPGMVFHVPPIAHQISMSETVLVTDSGSEVLTDFPRELIKV